MWKCCRRNLVVDPDIVDVSSGVEAERSKIRSIDKTICNMCQRGSRRKERKYEIKKHILWTVWRGVCGRVADE